MTDAQHLLAAAGIAPSPVKAAAIQARAAAEFLASEYTYAMSLVLGIRALVEEVPWDEERSEAEAAWERLGRHLGFTSTRPEKVYGTGPDKPVGTRHRPSCGDGAEDRLHHPCDCQEGLDQLGGKLVLPQVPDVAGVYRLTFFDSSGVRASVYLGQDRRVARRGEI